MMKRANLLLLVSAAFCITACVSLDERRVARPGVSAPALEPESRVADDSKSDRQSEISPVEQKETVPLAKTPPVKPIPPTQSSEPPKSRVTDTQPQPEPKRAPARTAPVDEPVARNQEKQPDIQPDIQPSVRQYTVRGQLTLEADDVAMTDDAMSNAIIYYVPNKSVKPKPAGQYRIVTKNKRFAPEVLAIPVGSTVTFPNKDVILHNVFSVSPISNFDLGFYAQGEGGSYTFKNAGLSVVYCNVHYSMQSSILVLETPFFTQVANDGSFQLNNIPAGRGTLHIWHPRASEKTQAFTVSANQTLDISLELTKPLVPSHLNKSGESYRPSRR